MTEPAAMSNLTAFLFVLMEASALKVLCKQCFKCVHGCEETDEGKDAVEAPKRMTEKLLFC